MWGARLPCVKHPAVWYQETGLLGVREGDCQYVHQSYGN